jgi:uncharacterized membrane protein
LARLALEALCEFDAYQRQRFAGGEITENEFNRLHEAEVAKDKQDDQ